MDPSTVIVLPIGLEFWGCHMMSYCHNMRDLPPLKTRCKIPIAVGNAQKGSINKPLSHPESISLMQKVSQCCFLRQRCLPYHGGRVSFALSEKQRKEVPLKTVELCAAEPWEAVPHKHSQSAQSKDTNVEKQSFHALSWFKLNASCCICRKIHTYTEAQI